MQGLAISEGLATSFGICRVLQLLQGMDVLIRSMRKIKWIPDRMNRPTPVKTMPLFICIVPQSDVGAYDREKEVVQELISTLGIKLDDCPAQAPCS